jgi:hypothetical protein
VENEDFTKVKAKYLASIDFDAQCSVQKLQEQCCRRFERPKSSFFENPRISTHNNASHSLPETFVRGSQPNSSEDRRWKTESKKSIGWKF